MAKKRKLRYEVRQDAIAHIRRAANLLASLTPTHGLDEADSRTQRLLEQIANSCEFDRDRKAYRVAEFAALFDERKTTVAS